VNQTGVCVKRCQMLGRAPSASGEAFDLIGGRRAAPEKVGRELDRHSVITTLVGSSSSGSSAPRQLATCR